jgi:hypothetical protein
VSLALPAAGWQICGGFWLSRTDGCGLLADQRLLRDRGCLRHPSAGMRIHLHAPVLDQPADALLSEIAARTAAAPGPVADVASQP